MQDPQHPLLRFERPPTELNEDGSRPRIVSDANRAAKIESLRRELAAAKAGQVVESGELPAGPAYEAGEAGWEQLCSITDM